jgi:hypothetical protein
MNRFNYFFLYCIYNSLSNDVDLTNNVVNIMAKLKVRANVYLYGTKTPEQLFYDNSLPIDREIKTIDDIGPIIEHTYIVINRFKIYFNNSVYLVVLYYMKNFLIFFLKVTNGGPFSVNYFQLIVDWPYEARSKIHLDIPDQNRKIIRKQLLYLTEKPTVIN